MRLMDYAKHLAQDGFVLQWKQRKLELKAPCRAAGVLAGIRNTEQRLSQLNPGNNTLTLARASSTGLFPGAR